MKDIEDKWNPDNFRVTEEHLKSLKLASVEKLLGYLESKKYVSPEERLSTHDRINYLKARRKELLEGEGNAEEVSPDPGAHYRYTYRGIKLDPYRIGKVYNLSGPQEHIVKKALRGRDKGHTYKELIAELRGILDRWEEILIEDNEYEKSDLSAPTCVFDGDTLG